MKKFILITTVVVGLLFSSPVSEERALDLAENFFFYRNNPNSSEFIVESIETYSKNNEDIFLCGFCQVLSDFFLIKLKCVLF